MTEEEMRKNQIMVLNWVIKVIQRSYENDASLKLDGRTALKMLELAVEFRVRDIEAWDFPESTRVPHKLDWELEEISDILDDQAKGLDTI